MKMHRIFNLIKFFGSGAVFVSSLMFNCSAQTLPFIENGLENYAKNNLQEKLFVHTDRECYLAGEFIWFKIYAVAGINNKPLDFSKIAYAELLDSHQIPVLQATIALNQANGNGSFLIPVTLENGNYTFRAYTSWMKNYGPEYYFQKTLTIINPRKIAVKDVQPDHPGLSVQFFPEGGNLVSGLTSRVAVKATGADGMGVNFKGAIINGKGDTVVRFSPLKFGMGSFLFTPDINTTYKAVIIAGNTPLNVALPAILDDGYIMRLKENIPGQLGISVKTNNQTTDTLYLLAHNHHIIKVAKAAAMQNDSVHFMVDKSLLGEGISQITIFNSARQPVCERLYFKRPEKKLLLNINTGQQTYSRRQKVSATLQAKDKMGLATDADLSMSVYRLSDLQRSPSTDIFSAIWLSSDLQGNIESPDYYLADNSPEVSEATDNLMLTQGWRRFDWSHVLNGKVAPLSFLPEIDGHIITAKIVSNITKQPAGGINAYLAVQGKRVQFYAAKSDSAGRLLFDTKNLNGTDLVVQTNTEIDSTYDIEVQKPFSEAYAKTELPPFSIGEDLSSDIRQENLGVQVQNSFAREKIRQFYEPGIDSSGFYKKPLNSYLLDDYTRFQTMEEVLREYVKEVNIFRQQKRAHIKVVGEQAFLEGDPLVLIDGLPVFNIDKVIATDPLKIRKLDVVPQTYFYGPTTFQGILSFTSYNGKAGGDDIDPHAVVVDYDGLQQERIFYSPVYETESQIKSRIPDFRNLLYWSHSVKANGAPVTFYTSDQPGKYLCVVQGITPGGDAACGYYTFEVKK